MAVVQDKLLKQAEVKELLQVSDATLETWRHKGQGPRFCKVGKSVRYRLSDVMAYIDSRMHSSTKEAAA
ncbi:MAG: hypothetical protein FD174_2869 [Geobacteraceae bacterium]|nr:MAG: hypothetical protein FD174_2869 [Geobacteraceae bacterium]